MVSLGQGIVDAVTKEVTEKVTKEVTERKNKEFAATLERIEREWDRERLQLRESVAREMLADGYSIDQVAKITLLPVGAVQSLARQAAHATADGPANAQKK